MLTSEIEITRLTSANYVLAFASKRHAFHSDELYGHTLEYYIRRMSEYHKKRIKIEEE